MASDVLLMENLAGEHGVGILRQIQKTVGAALRFIGACKLIHISSRLHTEMADSLKRNTLRQHTDIEYTALFDDLPGQISHLDADAQLHGVIGHLEAGIGDTAVVMIIRACQHKQAVAQFVGGKLIDRRFLLLSESSAPAGPSEPCHGEPRHEPSHGRCRGSHPDRSSWRRRPDRTCPG